MSVERVERKDGSVVWRVRWRQGGRNRSKVLGRKREAEAFDAELVRRKRTVELAQLDAGKESLADFGEDWWRLYAEPNLARSTLQVYAVQWDAHILPRLGDISLRELTPDLVNRFRLELEADGVGPASIRKSLTLLQGVLQRVFEWGRIPANPECKGRRREGAEGRSLCRCRRVLSGLARCVATRLSCLFALRRPCAAPCLVPAARAVAAMTGAFRVAKSGGGAPPRHLLSRAHP